MIELFQITGSASFAARAALEELGAKYLTVDVHPRRRDETPAFGQVNPLQRVPSLREGEVEVYETGAVLAWLGDRFPAAGLAPAVDDPSRGAYLRWLFWLSNTLHGAWWPVARKVDGAEEQLARHEAYLGQQLADGDWCLGDRFSLADVYLYMLVGWRSFYGEHLMRSAPVQAHYERVGARPAIVRTRELDDLDPELQRLHPELRAGLPI
jgi:glutathione S-transferase